MILGLPCWRAHAETVSLLTFIGLHAEPDTRPYTPTFVSELRRRLFAYVFNIDKVCASFQGRPPLLSFHYVSFTLPLDIPDESFMGGEEALKKAVDNLDDNGWNTAGILSSATQIRSRVKLALLKDELMAMALSQNNPISLDALLLVLTVYEKALTNNVNQGCQGASYCNGRRVSTGDTLQPQGY